MRLDDYQKWLDSMFVDEPAAPAAVIEDQPQIEPVRNEEPATPAERPVPVVTQSPRPPAAAPEIRQTPRPSPIIQSSDEVEDVPQIDDYLPFRRSRQPAEPEPAASDPIAIEHSEPVQTTIAVEVAEVEPEPVVAEEPPAIAEAEVELVTNEGAEVQPVQEPVMEEPAAPVAAKPASQSSPARRIASGRTRQIRSQGRLEAAEAIKPAELWGLVPRHLKTLFAMQNDEVAQNSYKREFKESRVDLISRLLDPTLSLEETARLLNVCPTTVRRYTNRGLLTHHRTQGDQRRFRLSDVLAFLDAGHPGPE